MSRSHTGRCQCRVCAEWKRFGKDCHPSLAELRARSCDDHSVDDAPTPEEIDPSLLNRFDCDHDDLVDPDAPLADDDQPYCDAP